MSGFEMFNFCIGLITFGGAMFCFGYGSGLMKSEKQNEKYKSEEENAKKRYEYLKGIYEGLIGGK